MVIGGGGECTALFPMGRENRPWTRRLKKRKRHIFCYRQKHNYLIEDYQLRDLINTLKWIRNTRISLGPDP